ncbi:MAG TPA: hypothetical protein VMH22_13365 [bacterium]|nr:hypothetical protein [bacterium]
MLSLLIVPLLLTGGFELGGRVGVLFPASGLETNHGDAALFGVDFGYRTGPNVFTLEYRYSGLHAKEASPYRLDINEPAIGYGRDFSLGRAGATSDWGLEGSVAAGFGLLSRTLGSARETGAAPSGHLDVGVFQRQGHSRLSLTLDNIVFSESQSAGSSRTVSLTYLIALKGGVAYVF